VGRRCWVPPYELHIKLTAQHWAQDGSETSFLREALIETSTVSLSLKKAAGPGNRRGRTTKKRESTLKKKTINMTQMKSKLMPEPDRDNQTQCTGKRLTSRRGRVTRTGLRSLCLYKRQRGGRVSFTKERNYRLQRKGKKERLILISSWI